MSTGQSFGRAATAFHVYIYLIGSDFISFRIVVIIYSRPITRHETSREGNTNMKASLKIWDWRHASFSEAWQPQPAKALKLTVVSKLQDFSRWLAVTLTVKVVTSETVQDSDNVTTHYLYQVIYMYGLFNRAISNDLEWLSG